MIWESSLLICLIIKDFIVGRSPRNLLHLVNKLFLCTIKWSPLKNTTAIFLFLTKFLPLTFEIRVDNIFYDTQYFMEEDPTTLLQDISTSHDFHIMKECIHEELIPVLVNVNVSFIVLSFLFFSFFVNRIPSTETM